MASVKRYFGEYYLNEGPAYGNLELSEDGLFLTPHFSIHGPYKRQGWGTKIVDAMFKLAEAEGLTIRWIDEPAYDGRGSFSAEGQAFADVYRVRKGIPLPWIIIVDHRRQYRGVYPL